MNISLLGKEDVFYYFLHKSRAFFENLAAYYCLCYLQNATNAPTNTSPHAVLWLAPLGATFNSLGILPGEKITEPKCTPFRGATLAQYTTIL
jgi:hypothetical protein